MRVVDATIVGTTLTGIEYEYAGSIILRYYFLTVITFLFPCFLNLGGYRV